MQKNRFLREASCVWKAKTATSKTWENFKTFFADEYSELKEEGQLTAKEAGFHQANIMQDILVALDNLANAAMEDRNIMAQLVDSNTKLTETNKQLAEQAKKLQDNYSQLHDMIKTLKTKGPPTLQGRTQRSSIMICIVIVTATDIA
eukprot:15365909-Ditylum_brightwellii.AAC.1